MPKKKVWRQPVILRCTISSVNKVASVVERAIIALMYVIAIGWLYVAALMALTEGSVVAGLLSFFFYGLFPLALFLWLVGTPARRRLARKALGERMGSHDRGNAQGDE
jgi:biotin transporter BioY